MLTIPVYNYTTARTLASRPNAEWLRQKKPTIAKAMVGRVGKTGFEPATPWSQTRCATGLRYFPNGWQN